VINKAASFADISDHPCEEVKGLILTLVERFRVQRSRLNAPNIYYQRDFFFIMDVKPFHPIGYVCYLGS